MLHLLTGEYATGLLIIQKDSPGILQTSNVYFLEKIIEAKAFQADDDKWYKDNSVIKWNAENVSSDIDRNSEAYQQKIIKPLKNLSTVLKHLIRHIHDNDPIIAKACMEMGIILENHVSSTKLTLPTALGETIISVIKKF